MTRVVPDPCRPPCGFEHVEVVGYRGPESFWRVVRRNVDKILWAEYVAGFLLDVGTFLLMGPEHEANPLAVYLLGVGGVPVLLICKLAVFLFGAIVAGLQTERWARRLVLAAGAAVCLFGAWTNVAWVSW